MNANSKESTSLPYKYFVCYEVEGITMPTDIESEILFESNRERCIASIFSDPKYLPKDPLRNEAIREVVLIGLSGKASELSREKQIEHSIKKRISEHPDSRKCYISFIFDGTVTIPCVKHEVDYGSYDVAFINIPYVQLDNRHKKIIDGIISSISITLDNYQGHNRIYETCILYRENRPLHALRLNITTKLTSIRSLTQIDLSSIKKISRKLIKHQDLTTSSGLLSKSLNNDNDRLLSFLAAWSGLEIFIQKTYKKFEDEIYEEKIEGKNSASKDFIDQLRKISQNKLKLNDKFTIISALKDLPEADRNLFNEIKQVRDNFVHGQKVSIESLPLEDTSRLLRKILSLQL